MARALYVAAELRIADLLAHRPMTTAELAVETATDEKALHRMLRALAAFGIFAQNRHGQFELTRRAGPLRSDIVGSLRDWTVLTGKKPTWDAFGEALEVVRTGQSGFQLAHGDLGDLYRFCRQDAEFSETFVRAQSNWTDWQRDAILAAFDFSRFQTVVDVGGGRGSMISGILRRCPSSKGILYDQPQTIELARPVVANAGVENRCQLVPGSFLESVPEGGDAYVIKHVLRDWDDETAGTILRNCHRAMGAKSVLLVIDAVLDPRNSRDRIVKLLDLEQLFWLNGTLRTRDQWDRLLEGAGFRIGGCQSTKIVDAVIIQAAKIQP
ncbi:MAG: acetylserotonin O-methyltransferase [Planctomycetes bacterium]|nr:acetylserotonin O-methyltransferase [Planctomycetota bacterium]